MKPLPLVSLLALTIVGGCGGGSNDAPVPKLLDDAQFLAFVDDDGDGLSFDDQPRMIHLSDFLAANRPGTKIIMLNAAAGWCGPCTHEAGKLSEFAKDYASKGVAVLTAVFQKEDASPSDADFTRTWAETFQLSVPTMVDSSFVTGRYFKVDTLPANMFVDAASADILTIATGTKPGDDPMAEYRSLLDHYLQTM